MDYPTNAVASHAVVVSASRAAAAPGLPLVPLQFEGARGLQGPSPTSAFRRVNTLVVGGTHSSPEQRPSPTSAFHHVNTLVVGGTHSSPEQRPSPTSTFRRVNTLVVGGTPSSPEQRHQDVFDVDLNKAYSAEDEMANLIPGKQILVEEGPRRSDGLKLDLNHSSDNDDAPSDWNVEGQIFDHKNSHLSPPPSSSPSPKLRNIDLNDQPFFCNDSSNLQPYFGESAFGSEGIKSGDSVITIMGTKVEVNRKDLIPQPPSLPNGRIVEPSLDSNMAGRGGFSAMGDPLPYACPPAFGYSPYMVDSRGASVVPKTWGSASSYQPPFVRSKIGTHPCSMGAGPSRANVDLDPGFTIEGENRKSGGVMQISNSGEVRLMGEHLRVNSQPSLDSGGVGKRKEPEGGLEPHPFEYKHQPQWE